jgi:hypothetical protein
VIAEAFRVPPGIVFTVNGAATGLMYGTPEALRALVSVLAHRRHCGPVTLTGTPAKIASSMAGRLSPVPGILVKSR